LKKYDLISKIFKVIESKIERVLELAKIAEVPPLINTKGGNKQPGLPVGKVNASLNNTICSTGSRPLKRASDICDTSLASRSYICKSLGNDESNMTMNEDEDDEDDCFLKNQDLGALFVNNSSSINKRFRKE
jgi:hypothetical protein